MGVRHDFELRYALESKSEYREFARNFRTKGGVRICHIGPGACGGLLAHPRGLE